MTNFSTQSAPVRLGSRRSDLALWQTHHVAGLLQAAWPDVTIEVETMSTKGDQILDKPLPQIGGKGLFTAELEAALHEGAIDAAVHSLKDLPTDAPPGLTVGAIPVRANPGDVLVSRAGHTLATLPKGAHVGTSSRRRAAQLRLFRPDLQVLDIRGNVPTRIDKALDPDGPYDAVVLAYAGLERLDLLHAISEVLPLEQMLPAPGQGALGVQCRDDTDSLTLLQPLDDPVTRAATTAERAFLNRLGGGCAVPIAAYATLTAVTLTLRGRVAAVDGERQIEVQGQRPIEEAAELGRQLAGEALAQGAAALLEVAT
ncbi:MAG: hydroxymethylbilane synthase [Candidatus Promineifilaceae bacterium]|nr:hydroxymethylbilane synthase [Candidatus Promineifilaceae bacterium]